MVHLAALQQTVWGVWKDEASKQDEEPRSPCQSQRQPPTPAKEGKCQVVAIRALRIAAMFFHINLGFLDVLRIKIAAAVNSMCGGPYQG